MRNFLAGVIITRARRVIVQLSANWPHLDHFLAVSKPVTAPPSGYYPGTEEAHTNPTRQRGECLRALAGASG